ncbi:MAG: cyanophycin synthetase, partial [bacterium]|nr:cyanophycin synthetase [bacterium]
LQVVSESPRVVLDGAHNPDAAAVLANALPRLFKYQQLILVCGMLAPHEPLETLRHLLPLTDIAIFAAIENPRAHPPKALLDAAQRWQSAKPHRTPRLTLTTESPEQAFEQALAIAGVDDLILVTGSFYLVGQWRVS